MDFINKMIMRKINKIIIHCSASPEGRNHTIEDIRRWHTMPVSRGGRGWTDIGYHYVIHLDGSIHRGREESKIGAHCTGQNADSIGICYVGGLAADGKTPKDTRTPAQKESLEKLVEEIKKRYPGVKVYGHRDFTKLKACPSYEVNPKK